MGQAKKGKVGAVCLAVILLGGAGCVFKCTERIPAGYVGVVYNMSGGVDGEVLTHVEEHGELTEGLDAIIRSYEYNDITRRKEVKKRKP